VEPQPLKIGVIGAGVGGLHIAAYEQLPEVEVVALAGQEADRVQRLAEKHQIAHTVPTYEELLALPGIDAVSVCVPNALHTSVTIAALRSGRHVLVEKPLARTAAEGRTMVDAASEYQRVLMVSFDKRHRGDAQWLKQYIQSGALGKIYYAKAHWMRRAGIPRLGSWFVSKEFAGGGPLIDLGVHVLDLALHLMGEPEAVAVSASTYAEFGPRGIKGWAGARWSTDAQIPYEVEDLATAFIRLNGGATLLLEASWATHNAVGDDFGVTLYGTEGGAELLVRNYGHENTVRLFTDIGGAATDMTPSIPRGDGHLGVIRSFVAAVRGEAPVTSTGAEGLRRAEIIDACYRSAAAGREVGISQSF
jgi:predicted dehydrogenase